MFERNLPYPEWNPNQENNPPAIPHWTATIDNCTFSFSNGNKKCFRKNKPCGDYFIHLSTNINGLNWTAKTFFDEDLFKYFLIPYISGHEESFISSLRHLLTIKVEEDVLRYVNNSSFSEELKVCLYGLWHRGIIEERDYSPALGLAGHKQVIGIAIALSKKVKGESFIHDEKISLSPYNVNVNLKCVECNDWYQL